MGYRRLLVLPLAGLLLAGCSGLGDTLFNRKVAPDESQVLAGPPLAMPPEFDLQAPEVLDEETRKRLAEEAIAAGDQGSHASYRRYMVNAKQRSGYYEKLAQEQINRENAMAAQQAASDSGGAYNEYGASYGASAQGNVYDPYGAYYHPYAAMEQQTSYPSVAYAGNSAGNGYASYDSAPSGGIAPSNPYDPYGNLGSGQSYGYGYGYGGYDPYAYAAPPAATPPSYSPYGSGSYGAPYGNAYGGQVSAGEQALLGQAGSGPQPAAPSSGACGQWALDEAGNYYCAAP